MNKKISLLLISLLLLSMACSFGKAPAPVEEVQPVEEAQPAEEAAPPTEVPVEVVEEDSPAKAESEFPLPDDVDADSVTDLSNGSITFQTSLSLPDAISFYRFAFIDLGYKEREINTAITDATFSLVFDGHDSGKAIVLQGVDLGEKVNINLRFEDI